MEKKVIVTTFKGTLHPDKMQESECMESWAIAARNAKLLNRTFAVFEVPIFASNWPSFELIDEIQEVIKKHQQL